MGKIFNLKVIRGIARAKLVQVGTNYSICETIVDKYQPKYIKSNSAIFYGNNISNYKVRKKRKNKRIKREEREKY